MAPSVCVAIVAGPRVREFSREQSAYLDYHRVAVFKQG